MAYKHAPTYKELQELQKLIPARLPFTPGQIVCVALGGLAILGTAFFLWRQWPLIDDIIPTHYGFSGKADAWGSKTSLLPLLAVDILLYLGLVLLLFFPKIWNIPYRFTPETVVWTYQQIRSMLCAETLVLPLGFGYLLLASLDANHLSPFFLLIFLLAVFVPTIYYWRRLKKRLA